MAGRAPHNILNDLFGITYLAGVAIPAKSCVIVLFPSTRYVVAVPSTSLLLNINNRDFNDFGCFSSSMYNVIIITYAHLSSIKL